MSEEEKIQELQPLPCPFCGEIPSVSVDGDVEGASLWWVECHTTTCEPNPYLVKDTRESAILAWNTRK